jgi:hypothetical protein
MAEPIAVDIYDETTTGVRTRAFTLRLASEKLTVRELIRRRVQQEVADYNAAPVTVFHGLVQPTDTEEALNGRRLQHRKPLNPEAQIRVALEAFQRNGFFLLVGDRQVESLDEEIVLTGSSEVCFLKLVPLVGG